MTVTFNIPPKIRFAIYIVTGVGTPIVAYLLVRGVIGEAEVALWAAEVTFANGIAAGNTDIKTK